MRRIPRCPLALAVLLALPLGIAGAQTRATSADLSGTVADPSKAVLPGVTVTAVNVETGISRSVTTDGEGRYGLLALPPGSYRLVAELDGFNTQTRAPVPLTLGAAVDVSFVLTIAGAAERITVSAEAPVVDHQKTTIATVVSRQQIEGLPINVRNFISFAVITPGVTTDRTPQQGASATSGLTFAGQRARSNNITVDGVDNNDAAVGAVRATFSQEAVREFQVLTNSFTAEFGKASGGVVNIVTKSGTNRTAGNAFAYIRDERLNAKDYFEREKAPYGQRQAGFTLGGPIARDRAFYFVSFERLDIDAHNVVTIDDSTIVMLGATPLGTPRQILERAGFPIETGSVPYAVDGTQLLGKIDHQLSARQNVALRFNYAHALNDNVEPWGGQIARSRGASLESDDAMAAVSHTFVRGMRTVNELRAQLARRDQNVASLDAAGGPTIEVTGHASAGRHRFTPQPRTSTRVQLVDTLSYFTGAHQIKTGIDVSWIRNEDSIPLHFGGRYIFAASLPGALFGLPYPAITAIQAVALDLPAAYVQGYGNSSEDYAVTDLSLFVQDDWRLGRNATLKLGLRYQTQFWPDIRMTVPGLETYRFPADRNNLAPRLSMAWDPRGTGRTSLHASYGLFFDNHVTALAGIAAIVNGGSHVRTLVAQLPNPLPMAAWNSPGRRLPEPGSGYPSLAITMAPDMRTSYAHHASAGIDRELAAGLALSANVIHARGFAQIGTIDYNPIVPSLGPDRRPEDIGGVAGTSASILQYTSYGETWYRGLTVAVSRRFDGRYQVLSSYTLSKAEDTSTDFLSAFVPEKMGRGRDRRNPAGFPIGFDPHAERGPSTQDQRHRFVLSGLVGVLGGFQISAIATVASGRPYNILAGADLNGDGNGGSFPPDRARTNPSDPSTSVGRLSGILPAQSVVDLRMSRRFSVRGRLAVDAMVEAFNALDRTNFTDINNIFGSGAYPSHPLPSYGEYTQVGPPRQLQLGLKVGF